MPKRNSKTLKEKGRSYQAEDGEVVLASRRTFVSNGIVSIVIPSRLPEGPRLKPWDNEELAEIYAFGAR